MKAYEVFLGQKLIDTVFWVDNSSADEVRRSLINHDGYDSRIYVVRWDKRGRKADYAKGE